MSLLDVTITVGGKPIDRAADVEACVSGVCDMILKRQLELVCVLMMRGDWAIAADFNSADRDYVSQRLQEMLSALNAA